jgi:acetate kinase
MTQTILIINCGSSSVKFSIMDPDHGTVFVSGLIENINMPSGQAHYRYLDQAKQSDLVPNMDYLSALGYVQKVISQDDSLYQSIVAVGHRVVHGGEAFSQSVLIDDAVLQAVEACNDLAPLHNPANLMGMQFFIDAFTSLPQAAVFDTAFHQTLPRHAFLYPIPTEFYEKHGVRRYGFHGTSHRYVTMKAAEVLARPVDELNLISAHLGNGCSLAAVKHGQSVDTTMGLTPLEGLVMGTRSGDVDPGLHAYLMRSLGYSIDDVDRLLNKQSGLLGLSQQTSDMRALSQLAEEGDEAACLAIEICCYVLAKHIAAMRVGLSGLDALIFTGGIGENAANIREKTLKQLSFLGVDIDLVANQDHGRTNHHCISKSGGCKVLVIPTNEELMIARDTEYLIGAR